MNNYLNILKKLNSKAFNNGDVPVSCIIIKNSKIISKSYNQKYKNNNPFDHAEIIAIKNACKKLKTYNLMDCIMITTLKPCKMCEEVIRESKINKVYYILNKTKIVNSKLDFIKIQINTDYFESELKQFFKDKR